MVATATTGSAVSSPSGRESGGPEASVALLPQLAEALPAPMDVVPEDVPLRPKPSVQFRQRESRFFSVRNHAPGKPPPSQHPDGDLSETEQ